MLPYYAEQLPDARGYAANPAGSGYVDSGVGGFLTERNLLSHPSAVDQFRSFARSDNSPFQSCGEIVAVHDRDGVGTARNWLARSICAAIVDTRVTGRLLTCDDPSEMFSVVDWPRMRILVVMDYLNRIQKK